jgi:hypothetical protein
VVADRGLRQPERPGEVALAHLTLGGDQADQSKASGIRQNPQAFREALGVTLVERRLPDHTAGGIEQIELSHQLILTSIDGCVNVSTSIDMP